jgi:hypothetical protein
MSGKTYQYNATQVTKIDYHPEIVELILMQVTLKAAIKMWGQDATNAAKAEMKQLHWCNTFKPVCWTELSHQ